MYLSMCLSWFDKKIINGRMVDGTASQTIRLGRLLSKIQTGALQDYLMYAFLFGALMMFYLLL